MPAQLIKPFAEAAIELQGRGLAVIPLGGGDGIPGVVYSYPSGHILECLTILGMIALRYWRTTSRRRLAAVLVILVVFEVVLVGIARLAL